jgi:hypothetical protein
VDMEGEEEEEGASDSYAKSLFIQGKE